MSIRPDQTATYTPATYAVFDRALGLSANNQRDGGMTAYIKIAGGASTGAGSDAAAVTAQANPDSFKVVSGVALTIADPSKGLMANDVGIYGVAIVGAAPAGLTLNANGTFTYASGAAGSFTYCGNGDTSGNAPRCATVTLEACTTNNGCMGGPPTAVGDAYSGKVASRLQINAPGVLQNDIDPNGFSLKASKVGNGTCADVQLNADGSFVATGAGGTTCSFTYNAVNSQNTASEAAASVTLTFPLASNLAVHVKDAKTGGELADYRWIIEEDQTIPIDANVETTSTETPVRNAAINFHTSHMPVVAQGCVGPVSCESGQTLLHEPAVCDIGNGQCRPGAQKTEILPSDVSLDPAKRYYISILPGDGANDSETDAAHGMGGAQIAACPTGAPSCSRSVDVSVLALPYPTAKISIFVFEDDNPLNGEADTGGGVDVLAPNEPGLGGFNIVLLDKAGMLGDAAGQLTYDEFGQPVSNSLAHTIDQATGNDACAISPSSADGIVGMIVTCPKYEVDPQGNRTNVLSPLAGHALVANMYPGLYEVHTTPSADRVAKGEEWLQTNTLDGTKDIEAFIKPDEPGYFQEFGPGGFHVAVGFANPKIINARLGAPNDGKDLLCSARTDCTHTINGLVTSTRLSRTPDQRVYSSGSYDAYAFAQCYVSLGTPDGEDFAFQKCDADGKFQFTGVPSGDMKITVFDQWNDLLVDGLSTPVRIDQPVVNVEIPVTQWRTNLAGRIFLDQNGDNASQESEPGASARAVQPALPRRQLQRVQQYRPRGLCRIQRSIPDSELAGRRHRQRALQTDRRARRVRRRRSCGPERGRQLRRPGGSDALRRLCHRRGTCQHQRNEFAASGLENGGRALLCLGRLPARR